MKLNLGKEDLIEAITPEILKTEKWKGKKFRRYDVSSPVPAIYGGKRHFVNQASEEQLAAIVGKSIAKNVLQYLSDTNNSSIDDSHKV